MKIKAAFLRPILRSTLVLILALLIVLTAVGCGQAMFFPSKENSSVTSHTSQIHTADIEKNLHLTTAAVNIVPYSKKYFDDYLVSCEKVTIITAVVQSSYLNYFDKQTFIRPHNGDAKTDETTYKWRYNPMVYEVSTNSDTGTDAYLIYLIAAGVHKPSEFELTFEYYGQDYTVPFPDTIGAIPQDITSGRIFHEGNIAAVGGSMYYVKSISQPQETQASSDDSGTYSLSLSLCRIDSDVVSVLSPEKFSLKADKTLSQDKNFSRINVSFSAKMPNGFTKPFEQTIVCTLSYSYPKADTGVRASLSALCASLASPANLKYE